MTGVVVEKWAPQSWVLGVGAFLLTCFLLPACTTMPQAGLGASSPMEPVTDFDETDVRRRARLRLQLASTYFEQGQTTVALDELKQALAIDATLADAYNLRGLIYMRMNEIALAEDGFKRALVLNPKDSSAQHNYGWLLCQQKRYQEADQMFAQAASNPNYAGRAKTLMTQGLCQMNNGQDALAEQTFFRSYEADPGNPLTGYNLALLLFKRGDLSKAQFYIRRLNNTEYANAESLWLGIKVEQRLNDRVAMNQLADQLKRRFSTSKEWALYQRGAFNE